MDDTKDAEGQTDAAFNKTEFDLFVKEALNQIKKINESYKRFFEASEGKESIIKNIETYLEDIKQKYEYLFSTNEAGTSRIVDLNTNLDAIKKYHQELLDGEESIQSDISKSREKITEFFAYLFGSNEDSEGQEKKIKNAIEEIINFHTDLTKEGGYSQSIEKIHREIIHAHEDIFLNDEVGQSKASQLNENIEQIKGFRITLEDEIKPFINETKKDIEAKQRDVAALLDYATGSSLIDSFLKSKSEYRQEPNYKKSDGSILGDIANIFSNIFAFLYSLLLILIDYALFISPLLLSVFIFVQPDLVASIVGIKTQETTISSFLGGLSFYGRLIISLPLWWISWFGQRSISQKRRLAEEYNHKAQVTKMYLNFVSKETEASYPLELGARVRLHDELINVIARHPGKVYGKDETILDKIIQLIYAGRNGKDINPDGN